MKTHEWAARLRQLSDVLLQRASVEVNVGPSEYVFYHDKKEYLEAVAALAPGIGVCNDTYFSFRVDGTSLEINITKRLAMAETPMTLDPEFSVLLSSAPPQQPAVDDDEIPF